MEYKGNLAAPFLSKSQADKKYIKRMSNVFSVPLILEQVIGTVVLLFAAVIAMLVHVSVIHDAGSFSLKTFISFLNQSDNSDLINNIFYALSYFSYMFIAFIIISAVLRQNPLKVIPIKVRHSKLIFPAIVIGLFFSVIGELFSGYFGWLLQLVHLRIELPQFSFPNNTPALIVYFIEISVLAPICEEAIFRGMIMQNLRRYGNFFAVLVSSLMFGILHGNLEQTPFAFIVGIALGITVIETGSIFVSMLLHCCINTISIVFSAISCYGGDGLSNRIYAAYVIFICALAAISVIVLKEKHAFKNVKKRYFSDSMPVPQAFTTFITTPGFIVFLVFYILIMALTLRLM